MRFLAAGTCRLTSNAVAVVSGPLGWKAPKRREGFGLGDVETGQGGFDGGDIVGLGGKNDVEVSALAT
ncbi:hypothetical protein Ssi02_51130 [Sinosporangium siamense]|uniref:Uncharacterized protein n=1 Tax=Sinosporangium siamense TaxID=1367973 RepID=A0A919RJB8_9ACTN|nr:hypothetical protein Ssi02_51130 [Sinosporangium siamense]